MIYSSLKWNYETNKTSDILVSSQQIKVVTLTTMLLLKALETA